jgi:hypothetical protein
VTTGGPQGAPGGGAGDAGAGGPGEPGGPGGARPGAAPSDEEVRAALEEQMRRLTVEDVLLQTVVTLVNLGARKLGLTAPPEEAGGRAPAPDLGQAHQAIEATRALLPLVSGDVGPIRDALSQLQVAYARAAQSAGAPGATEAGAGATGAEPDPPAGGAGERSTPPSPPGGPAPGQGPAADPEREKARSKIWTPPGA